jgi:hypothetical protein
MDDLATVEEKIDWILTMLDRGRRGPEQTLTNLRVLLSQLDQPQRNKSLDYVFELLVRQTRQKSTTDPNQLGRQRTSIGLLFKVLFEFGRVELTLCKILAYIDVSNSDIVNNWMNCVFPEITSAVYVYSNEMSQGTLDALKEHVALYSHPGTDLARAMPAVSPNLHQLVGAIESAEFSRFEQQLRNASSTNAGPKVPDKQSEFAALNPRIEEALKEASDYLRSEGTLDPKKAADLLRSSIDESHREIVKRLAERTGSPYGGGEKDGKRREYLRTVLFISEPEEKFFSAIYTLLSEEASHRLIAPRETVLVMEHTVRSYLLLLVRRLSSFSPPKTGAKP